MRTLGFLIVIMLFGGRLEPAFAVAGPDAAHAQTNFPKPLEDYHDDQMPGLVQKLVNRTLVEPFNLVGTLIFFCAILHTFLTAKFMHIASLVPGFSPSMKYAVVAGAVTGGGLTVIANAPNPAGQSILASCFGKDGISPGVLLLGAIVPTIIMTAAFMLLP